MNVLILNQHSNNFGDDAAGCALVEMLLKYDNISRIDLIYNSLKEIPVNNPKVFHHLDISFGNVGHEDFIKYYLFQRPLKIQSNNCLMREWIDLIRGADLVFMSPCGANIGIYKDWPSLIRILMAIMEKKDFVFHYNTIGKSGNLFFDTIAKYVLKRSKIYVREKKSQDYLNSIGIASIWGPDTAFALKDVKGPIRENVISFVPSSFDKWHPEYKNNPIDVQVQNKLLPQLAKWSKDNNYEIEILPHLNSDEEKKYNLVILKKLKENGAKKVRIRNDISTVWDYDNAIGTSKFSIGMRYHTIVLSSKNKRPFIAISYENKMKEVSSYMKMEDFIIDLHKLDDVEKTNIMYNMMDKVTKEEKRICDILLNEVSSLRHLCEVPIKQYFIDHSWR